MSRREERRPGKTDIHLHMSLTGETIGAGMYLATAAEMLPHLERLGIAKGILMSVDEARGNEVNRRISEQYPDRFAWMCNIDPEPPESAGSAGFAQISKTAESAGSPEPPESVRERLARWQAAGAVGVGELVVNQRIDSPFIQSVLAAAEQLRLPVLFHMSPEAGFNYGIADEPGLPLLEAALQQYPDLVFIGHSQPFWHEITGNAARTRELRNAWGDGPVVPGGRLPELFARYPNLRGDLSANSGGRAIMRDEAFGLAFLERFQDQLMFGSDMGNRDTIYPLGAWLDRQYENGSLSAAAYEKICWRNAGELFGI